MVDLDALIAKQRNEVEKPKTADVDIVLGGELVSFVASKILPADWQALVARFPGQGGTHDKTKLPRAYPADRITLDGQPVTGEQWSNVWDVLEAPDRDNVNAVMWGLNYYDAYRELARLGKAAAARQSSSPTNRASRRAASKAGSQQKSPGTTPRKGS